LSEEFIESVEKIVVCKGEGGDSLDFNGTTGKAAVVVEVEEVEVSKEFNTQSIVDRILGNRKLYEDRNRRKMEKQKLEKEMEGKEKEKRRK
jgi:ligand-binding sensor protein